MNKVFNDASGSAQKRIAFNTLIIYVRMIIVTLISLVTTRYVLQALGVADYGLYNVVGSIIVMLNTVSVAMHTTTRRYINIEMGKPAGNPNKIFCICLYLHCAFALAFLLIAETVGIWYINNYLNVLPEKLVDAHFVFQVSIVVACIGLVNVPYQGVLDAFEKFGQTALIDIFNAIIKLIAVLFLIRYDGNSLRFYALAMSLITLFQFTLFRTACYRQFRSIVILNWYWDKAIYKDILVFNNYTALGATSWLGRTQGSSMIVNYFFGTAVNGAFAVAYQIQNFVSMFIGNLGTASAPQITQSYGRGERDYSIKLCSQINRYTILIMVLLFFPIFVGLHTLLTLWLGKIPEGAFVLCQWTLIYALVGSFSAGIPTLIHATGKIKYFQLVGSLSELAMLPISFSLFTIGYPPVTIIIVLCVFTFFYRFISLWMMRVILDFNVAKFVRESYLTPICVIVLMTVWSFFYISFSFDGLLLNMGGIFITGLLTLLLIFCIGITTEERARIWQYFKKIYI